MAKTYEELLEQAAIIRDETAAGKNTAERVGGTITDAVDYVKELKDTYAGIHAEAAEAKKEAAAVKVTAAEAKTNAGFARSIAQSAVLTANGASITANEAKTESAQAVSTAQAAQNKNAEQDNRLKNAEEQNTKQNERLLNYVYPKLYQLNEGAGARPFDGMYSGSASVLDGRKTVAEDGCTYKVVFASGKFLLLEINQDGEDAGLYEAWDKIISGRGSSEDYTRIDCLYYIYEEGEGSTYYHIDRNGKATEQSATYLLRRLVDKNVSEIAAAQTKNADQDVEIEDLGAKIRELGTTIHDNGNLYEGTAGASSVPIVLAKTFGGTVTATLGPATSARAGVMTIDHVNRISKLEDRVLNYLYQKIYQLNEGAGARVFDGFTEENGEGGLNLTKDTYRYSVLYSTTQKQFVLNVTDEASGVTVLYSSWPKISLPNKKSIASSESYALRNCLYYIYVDGEGSTYYHIDSNGVASEKSATYLLRRLSDKNEAAIAALETKAENAKKAADIAQTAAENAQSDATAAQTKNTEQDARLEAIENSVSHLSAAGRYWNEANGTPTAAGHYGSLDALRSLPEMLGLGRYLVKDDRTRRKLDPKDSTKYADDGTTAKLDGTDGQCMWCWNGFYANVWKEGDNLFKVVSFDRPVGNDISIWIPAGGISWLGAGVMDRTEMKLCSVISDDERYRGGNGTALDATKYTKAPSAESPQITMLGMPATMLSTTQFGEAARKRGEGWEANWFVARFVVEFLFEVIMGTENSQEAFNANKDANGLYQGGFGMGVTTMTNWNIYNGSYPIIPTSVGLEAGDGVCLVEYKLPQTNGVDGDTYKTFNVPVFFGLVGAGYGNLFQLVRGLIMNAGEAQSLVYVSPSMYAAYNPDTVADKIMVAECPQVDGYIKRKSYQGLCCMPTEVGGSETIRFADYFYTNAKTYKGLRVRAACGYANHGKLAGASFTIASHAATLANASYSAPLCYFEDDPVIPDSQSIANNS